jgi:glycosyltransferase involved in cell wall biosynthesis
MRVSAVVTCYNSARFIAQALESIRSQTSPADEILVIDDGSTDATGEIVRTLGDDIRYIRQENQGSSVARNAGVAAARHEWIAFLDADDLWHPRKLEWQRAMAAAAPELHAVFGKAVNFSGDTPPSETEGALDAFLPSAGMLRRDWMLGAGAFVPGFRNAEVIEWFSRMKREGIPHGVVPEIVFHRRLHEANKGREKGKAAADNLRALRAHLRQQRSKPDG